MLHRALVLVVLATLAAGCGSQSHRIVRISARDLGGHGTIVAVTRPSANGREAPLESVRPLVPLPLPLFRRCSGEPAVAITPGGSVLLRVNAGSSLRGQWESALLGNLYAAEADRLGLRPVGVVASSSGMSRPGVVGGSRVSFAAVRHAVRASAARVVELRREAGAVALTVRTDKPAAFLKHHGRQVVRTLQPKTSFDLTSVYVGVEDASGALVYAWGWLPAEGMMWARPDLDACGPIVHSQPVSYHGPPCAA